MEDRSLKRTKKLNVYSNNMQKEEVIKLNPNDGLDLGLFNANYKFKIILAKNKGNKISNSNNYDDGIILLDNNCKVGNIEVSTKLWEKLGKIDEVLGFL